MNDEFLDFSELVENNVGLQPLMDVVEAVMSLPDDSLTDTTIETLHQAIDENITPKVRVESIKDMQDAFEAQHYNRKEVLQIIESAKVELDNFLLQLQPSEKKLSLLRTIFNMLYEIFDAAAEQYHSYNIELPIMLEQGAKVPTYAHDTDAAADLYAADTVTLLAHSTSNMIRTGVHIGLPEGWMAIILPRSSIGAKTGLRLSNSAGVIDSSYRGQLGVLYDNISNSEHTIHAGDRIAQLLVMPSYRFKATVVEALDETDRGEGGFGSTGV